jgi:hypothetical protein
VGKRPSWENCTFAVFRNSPHFVKKKISLLCLLQLASASLLMWTNEVLCFQPYYFNFHSDIWIAIPPTHIYWHKCRSWGLPHQKFAWIVFCCVRPTRTPHPIILYWNIRLIFCGMKNYEVPYLTNFYSPFSFVPLKNKLNFLSTLFFNTLSLWYLATSKHGKYFQSLILEETNMLFIWRPTNDRGTIS